MIGTILTVIAWILGLLAVIILALFLFWLRVAWPNLTKPQPNYYKSGAIKAKAWKRLADHRKRQSKAGKPRKRPAKQR
jgi:hypothetical protein